MQSRKLKGNCRNPTAINVCKRRLLTCCHYLCTCSRFGLSLSPNHRLFCVINDQSQYRKFHHTYRYYLRAFYHTYRYYLRAFYHTYRYYLRAHFGQIEILSGILYIYCILYIRADYNDASSGFGLWAKTLRGQLTPHRNLELII